jgi:hypothetical protein
MVDAVRFAGGWLFDLVMAGGEVLVLTADHGDLRPLRILGAHAVDLECALSSPVQGPWPPQAIAAGADSCGSDDRVRKIVLRALDDGLADVRLWGDQKAAGLGVGVGGVGDSPVLHRLSVAARAFKAQALAAAAAPSHGDAAGTETFRRGDLLRAAGA